MAIADRPTMAPGPSAIQPYLTAGTRRVGRAPWEDELDKLLLGIPAAEWGSIRGSLGLSAGGGYAPGGGMASAGGGSGGGGASASAMAADAGGLRVGATLPGAVGAEGGPDPATPGFGQTTDVLGVLGTAALFGLGPVGTGLGLLGTMVTNPMTSPTQSLNPMGLIDTINDPRGPFGPGSGGYTAEPDDTADGTGQVQAPEDAGLPSAPADYGTVSDYGQPEGSGFGSQPGSDTPSSNSDPNTARDGKFLKPDGDGKFEPVPLIAHEGEFVIRPEAVAMLGVPFLEMLNSLGGPKTGERNPQAFRDGGLVAPPFGLTAAEAASFREPAPRDYSGGRFLASDLLTGLGMALLPPTPTQYVAGLSGYDVPAGADVRPGIDGIGAEFRVPGGDWQPAQRSGMSQLAAIAAPVGVGPASAGVLTSGVPIARRALDGGIDGLRSRLGQSFGGVSSWVSETPNAVVVNKVVVPEAMRGQGVGTRFMRDVIEYADAVGKPVALTPSADFGGNVRRLTNWYQSLGFAPNTGRGRNLEISESMIRPVRATD